MRNWIEIDGITSHAVGLRMARLPVWTTAAETVENIAVPGVAVEMDRHTGQYPDFDLELTGYLTRPVCTHDLARLNAWVQNSKRLIMSTQPRLIGMIRKVGQITPTRIGTRANEIVIPFTFQPFKYARENFPHDFDTSPAYIRNWGNIYAEPVYRVTVTDSEAQFAVNDTELLLSDLMGEIVIDLPRRKIYREDDGVLTIVQNQTSGAFWRMVLNPGSNTLAWDGISAASVTVNERYL